MVSLLCFHCASEQLVKNGKSRSGKQQYRCHACKRRSTHNAQGKGHSEEFKAQILALYFERPSMRGIQRATGVSRQTLTQWLKKRHADEAAEFPLPGADSVAGAKR